MSGSSTVTAAGVESGTPLVSRGVTKVVTSHKQREGGGFVVRRPVGGAELSQLSPFLMLDHLGKAERPKLPRGWHVTSTFCHDFAVLEAYHLWSI